MPETSPAAGEVKDTVGALLVVVVVVPVGLTEPVALLAKYTPRVTVVYVPSEAMAMAFSVWLPTEYLRVSKTQRQGEA